MAKYYDCPTGNTICPYWDWKHHKCAMEVLDGESPAGQCDEYDAFNTHCDGSCLNCDDFDPVQGCTYEPDEDEPTEEEE